MQESFCPQEGGTAAEGDQDDSSMNSTPLLTLQNFQAEEQDDDEELEQSQALLEHIDNRIKPGAFAAVTDLGKPWMQDELSAVSTIVIDDRAQEKASPAPMVPYDLVTADLAEVIGGTIPVRFDPAKRSAFIFRGMAAGDFAVAAMAYRKAAGQNR